MLIRLLTDCAHLYSFFCTQLKYVYNVIYSFDMLFKNSSAQTDRVNILKVKQGIS